MNREELASPVSRFTNRTRMACWQSGGNLRMKQTRFRPRRKHRSQCADWPRKPWSYEDNVMERLRYLPNGNAQGLDDFPAWEVRHSYSFPPKYWAMVCGRYPLLLLPVFKAVNSESTP